MKKYVLLCEFCGDYSMTTSENYHAMVSDARKVWHFYRKDGFLSVNDVLDYVVEYFKIDEQEIEVIY